MSDTYRTLLGLHVLVGTMALATFWGAVLARKGGALHRRCGYGFAATMAITIATAVPLCLLLLWDPLTARPPAAELTAFGRAEYARVLRQIGSGLLEVSLVTGALLQFGVRALRRRGGFSTPQTVDLVLAGTAVAAGLLMLIAGLHPALPYFKGTGFGLAVVGGSEIRALLRSGTSRSAWIVEHLNGVMGAGAIAHGSLTVNIARGFTDDVGLMFLPAGVTVLLFAVAIRVTAERWRRQLDGVPKRQRAARNGPPLMSPHAVRVVG